MDTTNTTTTITTTNTTNKQLFSLIIGSITLRRMIFSQVKEITTIIVKPMMDLDQRPRSVFVFKWKKLKTNIELLCKYGYYDLVKWAIEIKPGYSMWTDLQNCLRKVIHQASMVGNIDMLEFCLTQVNKMSQASRFIDEASFFGQNPISTPLYFAAVKGQFKALKHVLDNHSRFYIVNGQYQFCIAQALIGACSSKLAAERIQMVLYLLDIGKDQLDAYNYTTSANAAASMGNVDALILLKNASSQIELKSLVGNAIRNGHLETLKYIHSVEPVSKEYFSSSFGTGISDAIRGGHYEMVTYINDHLCPIKDTEHKRWHLTDHFLDCAIHSHSLAMVELIHKLDPQSCSGRATMTNAALNGDLHIVEFLHKNRTEGCLDGTVLDVALAGHYNIAKFLYSNRTEPIGDLKGDMGLPPNIYSMLIKNRSDLIIQ
ncbi:hypothetical protein DFA_10063 [Cavenderia fasciculata]|uniref:Ankyrin repeat-containing protein n=1 Tax=Cavenderia fasciculata TaxID=261658 RepID=F4Q963_CACFS|nr:uncharacterized protein DFA_10063 [Cavenderia fasciculata]EGG15232.1 hypothetical protein DFA_10063 [Cavenderia fasciculata]|eukprot:XP_004351952.1 hypothetical protein DFA_10063 [Cavenderia fasciculata]